MNNSLLKRIINKYDVISFDIFDTLIKRNCYNPTDIFIIVEKRFNSIYHKNIKFYDYRVCAEKIAKEKCNKKSVTLDEIYDNIDLSKVDLEKLKELEIETELEYCTKNANLYDIYDYCLLNKKMIICVSDMYLDKKTIFKILSKNGYHINESNIFISCEYDKVKRNGSLFKQVLKELDIDKKKVLHIGDNLKADILGAEISGINSFLIANRINNTLFLSRCLNKMNFDEKNIYSLINNNSFKNRSYYESFGYEILGPVMYSFVKWINNEALNDSFNNILFCARDMKLVHEMYDAFFKDDNIDTHYFYVSRKSTYLPYLYKNNSIDNFIKIIPKDCRKLKIDELLDIYNITIDDLKTKLKKYNIEDKKYNVSDLFNYNKFVVFYENEVKKAINHLGKKQYENFISYLNSLNVTSKNTVIVDLGWHGTTQNILNEILDENISGYYFGLISDGSEALKKGFFCKNANDLNYKLLYPSLVLNELFFSALHGTTLSYNDSNETPYVLGKSSNENNQILKQIHSGVRNFISDIKFFSKDFDINLSNVYIDRYFRISLYPTLTEANSIGEIYEEKKEIIKLAAPKSLFFYIFHPKKFKYDFLDSKWKIGFLKRLFFLPISYYYFYKILLKRKEGKK